MYNYIYIYICVQSADIMIDGIYDMCIICGYNMIYNNGIAKYDNFFVGRVFADFAGFQGIVSPINGGDIYR